MSAKRSSARPPRSSHASRLGLRAPVVVLAVDLRAGEPREAQADLALVARVDVGGVTDVERDDHARSRHREALALGLAELHPAAAQRGQLHVEERQLGLPERAPPVGDQRLDALARASSARGRARVPERRVGLTLVPHDAAQPEAREGPDAGLEQEARLERMPGLRAALVGRDLEPALQVLPGPATAEGRHVGVVEPVADPAGVARGAGQELVRGQRLEARVGLGAGPADGVVDQADGHAEPPVQLAPEEVGHAREARRGLGVADTPARLAVEPGRVAAREDVVVPGAGRRVGDADHVVEPQLGDVGRRDLLLRARAVLEQPAHVRLAGAQPHLAHEHVLEPQLVLAAAHLEHVRSAGLERVELDEPRAALVGARVRRESGEAHLDALARGGSAPHAHGLVALQDHVVTERAVEGQGLPAPSRRTPRRTGRVAWRSWLS